MVYEVPKVRLFKVLLISLAVSFPLLLTANEVYYRVGKTPMELLDYIDKRLEGHPKLEWAVAPFLNFLRSSFDAPKLSQRMSEPFVVPLLQPLKAKSLPNLNLPPASPGVLRVGLGQQYLTIQDAAKEAKDGSIVEIVTGNYYGDVTVWNQKSLVIRSVGGRARIYADGKAAEGKAIFVFRDGNYLIDGIDFVGTKVPDKNGAGIRFMGGHLIIRDCLFYGNENGILGGNETSKLEIYNSEFAYSGHGDGYSHSLYVSGLSELIVKGNYFHHANRGHHIKSRAKRSIIAYNRITDEIGGRASYEVDLPNGGEAFVMFNLIEQSRTTENSTLISYGAEGLEWNINRLWMESNTLVNNNNFGGAFLRVVENTDDVSSFNNLLVGPGRIFSKAKNSKEQNIIADWSWFEMPQRYNFNLKRRVAAQEINITRPDGAPVQGHYIHPRVFVEN